MKPKSVIAWGFKNKSTGRIYDFYPSKEKSLEKWINGCWEIIKVRITEVKE